MVSRGGTQDKPLILSLVASPPVTNSPALVGKCAVNSQEQEEKSKEVSAGKRSVFGTGSGACPIAHIGVCCAMASLGQVGYILMETASQIGQETLRTSKLAALVICSPGDVSCWYSFCY